MGRRGSVFVLLAVLLVVVCGRAPPAGRPDDLPGSKLYDVMRELTSDPFSSIFGRESREDKREERTESKGASEFVQCGGCEHCGMCDTVYMSCHANHCEHCEDDGECATKCHREECMPRREKCMKAFCSKPKFRRRSLNRVEPELSEEAVPITPTPEPENENDYQDIFDAISGKLI